MVYFVKVKYFYTQHLRNDTHVSPSLCALCGILMRRHIEVIVRFDNIQYLNQTVFPSVCEHVCACVYACVNFQLIFDQFLSLLTIDGSMGILFLLYIAGQLVS